MATGMEIGEFYSAVHELQQTKRFQDFQDTEASKQMAHLLAKQAFAANHPSSAVSSSVYLYKHDSCQSAPCTGSTAICNWEPCISHRSSMLLKLIMFLVKKKTLALAHSFCFFRNCS
jgi:hypothetical protein